MKTFPISQKTGPMHGRKTLCCAMVLSLFGCGLSAAATLVSYTFPTSTALETGSAYAPITSGNLTASNITNPGNNLTLITVGSFGYPSTVFTVDPDGNTSANLGIYLSFTVTAGAGVSLDLTSVTLQAARGGGALGRGFTIRTSADGFASDLIFSPTSNTDLPTQRPNFTDYSVDLSGVLFNNVTTSLEFRIYPFTGADAQTIDFDNINLIGDVIPEPSTALMGLGTVCMFGFSRRRSDKSK